MLLYSVIARSNDGIILAETTAPSIEGNHPQVTQQLIQALVGNPNLVTQGNRKTFAHVAKSDDHSVSWGGGGGGSSNGGVGIMPSWGNSTVSAASASNTLEETYFHVQRGESIYFICISDDRDSKKQRGNYGFLLYVQKEFTSKYTPNKIEKANAYAFDKTFRKTYANLMHHCNTNNNLNNDPEINKLNAEIESIKSTMDVNLELLMRRGVRMEDLLEQSEDLLVDSQVFNKKATKLKRVMKRKSMYYKMILVAFGLFTIYLMMVKLCGFDLSCEADNNGNYGNYNGYYGNNNNNNNNNGYDGN